jgi:hypothetical protein
VAPRTAGALARDVIHFRLALCSRAVTHDELRALLPRYAAGELGADEAGAVRAHLAAGCTECMHEVFRRPVGHPRPVASPPVVPPPAGLRVQEPAAPRGRGLVAAIVVLGAVLAALAGWSIADLRRREERCRTEAARATQQLTDAEASRAATAARVTTLEHARASAEAEAARQAAAARASAEDSAQVRRDLEAAQARIATLTRGVRRRDSEIGRLISGVDEERALRDLAATPGLAVARLKAVAPFEEARGHVLWHPAREEVVLYAFGLPPLPEGGTYRVRLHLEGGRVEAGPAFKPGPRGDVALPMRLGASGTHLRAVDVVVGPSAQPVLAGRTDGPAG